MARRLGAGPVVLGGVKDIVERPLRTILAGLSIVLAVIALLVTLGFSSTVDEVTSNPDLAGDPWDVTVVPTVDTDRAVLTASIDASPEVVGWFGETKDARSSTATWCSSGPSRAIPRRHGMSCARAATWWLRGRASQGTACWNGWVVRSATP